MPLDALELQGDTVIQPFHLQAFIHLAIFELFEAETKCTAIWYVIGMIDGNLGNVSTGVLI